MNTYIYPEHDYLDDQKTVHLKQTDNTLNELKMVHMNDIKMVKMTKNKDVKQKDCKK